MSSVCTDSGWCHTQGKSWTSFSCSDMQCHFYSLKICRRDWPNWALHASPSSQLVPHAFSSERHDLNIWITTKNKYKHVNILGIPPFSIFFPSSLVVPQAFGWGPSMENIGQVLWNSCLPPTTTNHKNQRRKLVHVFSLSQMVQECSKIHLTYI